LAGGKSDRGTMITKLLFTVVGVLLAIGLPFVFGLTNLAPRLQPPVIAGIELGALIVGGALLYLALRERTPPAKP
jgi:hypothetical protein